MLPELGGNAVTGKPFGLDRMGADIARDEQMYGRRVGDLEKRQGAVAAERENVLAPMEAKLTAALDQPTPQRPKADIPQFKPEPVINAKDYEALSYGLTAFALIGGIASKGKWLEVSASLNGAMSGYLQGNKEVAAKAYRDYEEGFKGAMAKEAQANKEFEDILRDKKMRIQDQIAQYRIVAAKYDRQDALVAAQSRSLDSMWKSIESRKVAMAKLESDHQKAADQLELRRDIFNAKRGDKAGAAGTGGLTEKYTSDPTYKKNVDFWANVLHNGGSLPARFAQSGAGKMMMPDIINVVPTLGSGDAGEMGANKLTQRQLTAEAQKIGTQSASVEIANKELQRFIPQAEKAIDAVDRTGWKPLNKLIQAGEGTWSPEQGRLVVAHRAVLNAYSQLIQRGAPTVHSMTEAEAILSSADSAKVYKAKMDQLKLEGEAAEAGLKDASESLRARAKGMGKEEAPAATQTATGPNGQKLELKDGAWVPVGGGAESPAKVPISVKRRSLADQVPQ